MPFQSQDSRPEQKGTNIFPERNVTAIETLINRAQEDPDKFLKSDFDQTKKDLLKQFFIPDNLKLRLLFERKEVVLGGVKKSIPHAVVSRDLDIALLSVNGFLETQIVSSEESHSKVVNVQVPIEFRYNNNKNTGYVLIGKFPSPTNVTRKPYRISDLDVADMDIRKKFFIEKAFTEATSVSLSQQTEDVGCKKRTNQYCIK